MLNAIVDGGRISSPKSPDSRKGSTVIDFSKEGHFKVTRQGRLVLVSDYIMSCLYVLCACVTLTSR
jgi:hypothetical protein